MIINKIIHHGKPVLFTTFATVVVTTGVTFFVLFVVFNAFVDVFVLFVVLVLSVLEGCVFTIGFVVVVGGVVDGGSWVGVDVTTVEAEPPAGLKPVFGVLVNVVVVGDVTVKDIGLLYATAFAASITFTPKLKLPVVDVLGVYVLEVAPDIIVFELPLIEYHWYEYGIVPPETVAVNVSLEPVVIDDPEFAAEILNAGFTVTTTLFENVGYSKGDTIIPWAVYTILPVVVGTTVFDIGKFEYEAPELMLFPFMNKSKLLFLPLFNGFMSFTVRYTVWPKSMIGVFVVITIPLNGIALNGTFAEYTTWFAG